MSSRDHIGQTRALSCDVIEHGVVLKAPCATLVGALARADLLASIDVDLIGCGAGMKFGDSLGQSLECEPVGVVARARLRRSDETGWAMTKPGACLDLVPPRATIS